MKKLSFLLVLLLVVGVCTVAGAQVFNFQDQNMRVTLPDDMVLLTPDNLDQHEQWVAKQGTTKEALIAEWTEQGILAIAETASADARLYVTAVQDEDAKTYFDLDQQNDKTRAAYRKTHLKGAAYKQQGYTYQAAEWKKKDQYGRMLNLRYKRTVGDMLYRGYQRKTVRNGYTISLDYQVYGRGLKPADLKQLDAIMHSFTFTRVLQKPAEAAQKAEFTDVPPQETNTGKFTVKGVAAPGATISVVMMRMSSPEPTRLETTANTKNGKFSLDVQLPKEGTWLLTATVLDGATVVQEKVFDVTTYSGTLLPVNFDETFPEEIPSDSYTLQGTTIRGVQVQCMVGDSFNKSVRTNGTGRFKFKLPTAAQGDYNVTLVLQKKGLNTRRFTFTMKRVVTAASEREEALNEAVKPAYSTLTRKLAGYTGRIMRYPLYVTDIQQSGGQWLITMAMKKSKSGQYSQLVVVTTAEQPSFTVDSQQWMVGRCVGPYLLSDDDGKESSYPCFELLFWDHP